MFRYKLRTLLIPISAWISAILGAICGMLCACVVSSTADMTFALGWGATLGLIPALAGAALVSDEAPQWRYWCGPALFFIAVASGASLYVFVVATAAV